MKMKKYSLLFAAIMALVCSCSSDDDTPNPSNGRAEGNFTGIIFATAITNPEGSSGSSYMQAIAGMIPGSYDNRNAIPFGFGATPIVTSSGSIYTFPDYMGNSKAQIERYTVDTQGNWVKQGVLSIPAEASAANIVELNSEKAYVTLQSLGLITVFNPTTMTKITDIDLNSLAQSTTNVSPAVMVIRDDKLFVGLNQMNAQWMPEQNTIELAVIDTKTDQLEKHIVNSSLGFCFATRPVDPNSMFIDEQGDIYINCIGSFGYIPGFRSGIVRIKKGQTDIDPDYSIAFDQTEVAGLSTKYADFLAAVCYGGDGKLYAYANSNALDPDAMSNPYLSMTNLPVIIDLKAKTMRVIEGMEISNPHTMAIGLHQGLVVYGSSNKQANGFYTYDPKTQKVEGPVISVQGIPCFFHSFAE